MTIGEKVVAVLAGLIVVGLVFWSGVFSNRYHEVELLHSEAFAASGYDDFFENLAKEKGAPYAFEVLRRATLVPGTDIHLLGHVIGDILYKQQGIEGIHVCTQDFRNACSHSVVVGLFTERGVEALDAIAEACTSAPGGSGAYTMCFHGLGHGVLAYNNYDFEAAVPLCKQTGTAERNFREYVECVGGMTMEMIAGVHDRHAWELQRDAYLPAGDPLALCRDFVPEDAQSICYTYLTPHLFEAAGGNLGALTPEVYKVAFPYCAEIPLDETGNRGACYGGFGKEFVVLAQGRDVRDIGSMDAASLQKIRDWCALANDPRGEDACAMSALGSLFWGGENNPSAAFSFCEIAPSGSVQNRCYDELSRAIVFFLKGNQRAEGLCRRLPEPYRDFCALNT